MRSFVNLKHKLPFLASLQREPRGQGAENNPPSAAPAASNLTASSSAEVDIATSQVSHTRRVSVSCIPPPLRQESPTKFLTF